ncbi:short-chain dehydrogenases protein [Fusarium langsethiae]|uniref:Short-chain dehydrogenases protein n=1 Tax=Fusarium langsethiae TaxID=179993 RepID=A0A0M9ESJ0_FUSLA|nr:short-chain dehydrogenases protein [Fusarium langsethiae]GKU05142.1 unnamed protein product [Fusarium langsethiae]GKU22272.1 unnamed protein product [Fusarium langsethiae]
MSAISPVILILGYGANVGQAVASKFSSQGYRVAVAARSIKEAGSTDTQLNIPSDFAKTDDIVNAFDKVKKEFGIPSVVVYNGNNRTLQDAFVPPLRRRQDKEQGEWLQSFVKGEGYKKFDTTYTPLS